MLALGAFAAQGASAVPLTVEGLGGVATTAYTSGDQDGGVQVLKSSGGSVSCVEASFLGYGAASSTGAVNEQTVIPNYPTEKAGGGGNCTAFGFAGAHIKANECTYTFTESTNLEPGKATWSAERLHLVCPAGKAIEITPTSFGISVCTQTINAQTPTSGHIVGKNVAGSVPMDVTLEITLTGIHYTGNGGSCGDGTTHTDGSLTGNSTVKCYSDAAHNTQVGCTFS